MPKKRTKAQLEHALKAVVDLARRNEAIWDKAADRVAEVEAKNDDLKTKLHAETFRADNLLSETDELNTLLRDTEQCAISHRAEAAELNLIYFRKALEASNTVSLRLLDIVKQATTPVMVIKGPDLKEAR